MPQPPVVDDTGPELEIVLEIEAPVRQRHTNPRQRHTNPYYKSQQKAKHQRREKKLLDHL